MSAPVPSHLSALFLPVQEHMAFTQGEREGWRAVSGQDMIDLIEANALVLVASGNRAWKADGSGYTYCQPVLVSDAVGIRIRLDVGCGHINTWREATGWVHVASLPQPVSAAEVAQAVAQVQEFLASRDAARAHP